MVYSDDEPDRDLENGITLKVAGHELGVIHTPGHSPGSCCFRDEASGLVLSGDTLFNGGPGATGRSFSDEPTILRSIRDFLLTLPDETIVHTGHGDSTTIGAERQGVLDRLAELASTDAGCQVPGAGSGAGCRLPGDAGCQVSGAGCRWWSRARWLVECTACRAHGVSQEELIDRHTDSGSSAYEQSCPRDSATPPVSHRQPTTDNRQPTPDNRHLTPGIGCRREDSNLHAL